MEAMNDDEQSDDGAERGTFKRASADVIAGRKIVKIKGRLVHAYFTITLTCCAHFLVIIQILCAEAALPPLRPLSPPLL